MNSVVSVVKVGISDLDICKPPQTISTAGLGSCVGLVLYEERKKICGLVHVMLPDSTLSRTPHFKPGKFADTGIAHLIKLLEEQGCITSRLKAKFAGGAQMFKIQSSNRLLQIGSRNVEAVEKILNQYRIPIIASDVGGNKGRTIEFDPETSKLKIRTIQEDIKYI